ncbi:MAG TPA: VTT domain-containing protein [Deinococcales bacterium]|jgi:membrane protein DedA with SNARE-associated domain|nr:VTT domain-containing protein [Deinococcales bacterium]
MGPLRDAVLHAAGQWWIYPLLGCFFFVDGFAMVLPSETLVVALAALSRQSGQPDLWLLGLTALLGAIAGDNMAYALGQEVGLHRWGWMRRPKVQRAFGWARGELDRRGAVLVFTARYIPWGRVAVNYTAGATRFPRKRFVALDAAACAAWVLYCLGIGTLASSFPWLEGNPLLGVGAAVVFAVALGLAVDHGLRWYHRRAATGKADDRLEDEAGSGP